MEKNKLISYIKENKDVLGVDLYWVSSFVPLRTKGDEHRNRAIQHIYDFLKIIVEGTFNEKLEAVEKYNNLRIAEDWCIAHNRIYITLLISELKRGNYGTEQYPDSFKEHIKYLKRCGSEFEPSLKQIVKVRKMKTIKERISRYNRIYRSS